MGKTIVCHCDDVEVEEIYSAVEQGYGDLETLKRFTGIGTGKCQGKCCLVQTLRVLAPLAPLDTERVDTKGGGSDSPIDGTDRAGDPRRLALPTIRPPVLPMRIDEILGQDEEEP